MSPCEPTGLFLCLQTEAKRKQEKYEGGNGVELQNRDKTIGDFQDKWAPTEWWARTLEEAVLFSGTEGRPFL